MKKPVKAKVPGPAKPAAGKPAQPGNRPGRGKAAHAKPAAKKPAHVSAKVKQARHATAVKAAKTRAANAKKAKAHPRRQLALGSAVACCSAEALAASLRLSGHAVSDADVLALYWHTARDEHAGASIVATLEAAAEFGLAGVRPVSFGPAGCLAHVPDCPEHRQRDDRVCSGTDGGHGNLIRARQVVEAGPDLRCRNAGSECQEYQPHGGSVILGLSLPASHAVLDTGSEWMTWGEPWPAWAFPGAVIEEAWAVQWDLNTAMLI